MVFILSTNIAYSLVPDGTISSTTLSSSTLIPGDENGNVCFPVPEVDNVIIVGLENKDSGDQIIEKLTTENALLEKKIENLEKIIALQEQEVAVKDKTIAALDKLLDSQKKAYEKQIEESKPSIFKQIEFGVICAAIGGAIVKILPLLL